MKKSFFQELAARFIAPLIKTTNIELTMRKKWKKQLFIIFS